MTLAAPPPTATYQQSLENARAAWQQQNGLTVKQVQDAYAQASVSLAQRIATLPATAPATAWNLQNIQDQINTYGANLDQRVLDALYAGVSASYYHAGSSVVTGAGKVASTVFGPEAVDELARSVGERAAAAYLTRTGQDGLVLSDRVWKANTEWRQAVQKVVMDGITTGQPAVQVAKNIQQYLAPGADVAYKAATAQRLRVPKDTSMPAMRVARTEMQNAFHEGTINTNSAMPSYQGIIWRLSGQHPVPDRCNDYAEHNGNGFWPKGSEPLKPHPHCFCVALPQHSEPEQFQKALNDWLDDPKSNPELEQWYQQTMKPVLDVNVASVAGASGGPLLGGYSKGEKVSIDVNGQQVVATIKGEHATKGVLRLTIDPGQGLNTIDVWRAPSKVKPYTGPPSAPAPPPTPAPPIPGTPVAGGFKIGDVVQGQAGITLHKVGHIVESFPTGVVKVQWSDGTSNNVPPSVLKNAPPALDTVLINIGDTYTLHMPEIPDFDGQVGKVKNVKGDGTVVLTVHTPLAGTFELEIPEIETFKLEPKPQVQTLPGVKPWIGAQVLIDMPADPDLHGKVVRVEATYADGSATVTLPGGKLVPLMPNEMQVVTGQTQQPAPNKPVAYLNDPASPEHGSGIADILPDTTPGTVAIQHMDGHWQFGVDPAKVSGTPPAPVPTPPPPAPAVVPQFLLGDKVEVTSGPEAGTKGTIEDPAATNTLVLAGEHLVKLADGSYAIYDAAALNKVTTSAVPPPPIPAAAGLVDVTQKGTLVTTDYKGTAVTATVQSFNQGKNVLVLKPLDFLPDLKGTTFTKSPKLVSPLQQPPAIPTPPSTPPPTPPKSGPQAGDVFYLDTPGEPGHGKKFTLDVTPADPTDPYAMWVGHAEDGTVQTFYPPELSATPPATKAPRQPTLAKGDKVFITDGIHQGQQGEVTFQSKSSGNVVVQLEDGTVKGFLTEQVSVVAHTAVAAPVQPPAPVGKVTDKGATVTTDYKGTLVTAKVQSHNVGKNVVVLKPINAPPGVPSTFTKAPAKVTLVTPGVGASTAAPVVTTTQPITPPGAVVPQTAPIPATAAPVAKPTTPPVMTNWQVQNKAVGGGHAKTIYKAPDGGTWMFKPDPTAAYAEQAGYKVMDLLGLSTPEMHVTTVGREVGSLQKFHDISGTVGLNAIGSLTDSQRAELQQHQVVDWLISQHDSNDGAMLLSTSGHVLAVDKGQAFKFLGRDKLHWTYKPNPNMLVYQPLFEGYIGGKYVLDRAATDPIVAKIEAMDEAAFAAAVRPYAEHITKQPGSGWADPDLIVEMLIQRKRGIRNDVQAMYDEADRLAGRATTRRPAPAVTTDHVTPISRTLVDGINQAGAAGQSIMVSGSDIENGTVLAYTMKQTGDGTKLVLQAKVRAQAEAKLVDRLDGISHTSTLPQNTDPQWDQALPAIKHINYHLKDGSPGKDDQVTPSKIQGLIQIAKDVQSGNMDPGKAAHYSDILDKLTGVTAQDVAKMTPDFLALAVKQYWQTTPSTSLNVFDKYTPPPAALPPSAPGKIAAVQEAPSIMRRTLKDGELVTTGQRTTSANDGVTGVKQFRMPSLDSGMEAQYMPHYGSAGHSTGSSNPYSRQGQLQVIVDNFQGTPDEVQRALDQFKRLGVQADVASRKDIELLYLRQQVHAMKLEQAADYRSQVDGAINDSTPVDEAIRLHQQYLASKIGVSDVTKMPSYDPTIHVDPAYRPRPNGHERQAGGYGYFNRFDITKKDLDKAMPGWGLAHNSNAGALPLVKVLLDGNGMMSPTEERVRNGVFSAGQNLSGLSGALTDMHTGGASYFFTRLSKPTDFSRGQFIFHTDLLLRTDMIHYGSDTYGQSDPTTKQRRNTSIDEMKKAAASGGNEAIFKNGFPLLQYLKQLRASSASERTQIIAEFRSRGIDQIRGVPIEDVVTVGR